MKKWRTWAILLGVVIIFAVLFFLGKEIYGSGGAFLGAKMHIPRPQPEPVFRFTIAGKEIVILNTIFSSTLAMLVLVLIAWRVSASMKKKSEEERIWHPRGLQGVAEWAMEYLINLLEGPTGRARIKGQPLGRKIFPLVATLFIFIIFANWFSLLPLFSTLLIVPPAAPHTAAAPAEGTAPTEGTTAPEAEGAKETRPPVWWIFGGHTVEQSEEAGIEPVPLLRAPNSHLAVTAAMALIAVVFVQFLAIRAHGTLGYLKHLATDAPVWMRFIMFPIHVISEISHVISLSARLFGNLYGGDVLLAVIFTLLAPIVPAVFFGIEAFFYYIQALLFSVLTTVYIVLAVGGGHEGEEHAPAHAH